MHFVYFKAYDVNEQMYYSNEERISDMKLLYTELFITFIT